MRSTWLLVLLACFSSPAQALELLCEGQVALGGRVGDFSFVLTLEEDSNLATVWTPEGAASGVLAADLKSYMGLAVAPNESEYSVTLNRYSGDIFIVRVSPPATDGKASFWGTCKRAVRQF